MTKTRLHLIDLLRLFSFLPIISYHSYSQVYFTPYIPEDFAGTFFGWFIILSRNFSYSGLSILVISFFLLGLQTLTKNKIRNLLILVGIGALMLMVSESDDVLNGLFWDWDIYQFLIVAILSTMWLQYYPKLLKICAGLGLLMTFIPFYSLADRTEFPLVMRSILFGVCDEAGRGGWALLPWIGLAWFSFYLGTLAKKDVLPQEYKKSITKKEWFFWAPALIGSLFFWGAYYPVPLDSQFYCFVFRKLPHVFWAHIIWIFFGLRLSLLEGLNAKLHGFKWVRWISELKFSTYFGLFYLVHLFYLWAGSYVADEMKVNLTAYNLFVLALFPVTELITRALVGILRKIRGPV